MTITLWLAIAGMPVALATLYLLSLTLLSKPVAPRTRSSARRLVVLVPAHNEQAGIGDTLQSLQAMDYPRDHWRLVVIADNCTDDTAGEARRHGAQVIERRDTARRGKGFALQHAISGLLPETTTPAWEALVVVDADTRVTPNLLHAVAARLDDGAEAVQATYLPRPAGRSHLAVVTDVSFTAFHVVRSAARERLGLSVGLRGNGMAFSRAVLAEVPHDAFSRTEDLEFGVRLGLHGVRVAFAGEATVFGDMPERSAAAARQRERWIGGRLDVARSHLGPLIAGALRHRSLMLADLAVDLMLPPLSALCLAIVAGTIAAVAGAVVAGQPTAALAVWGVAAAALTIHVLHAADRAGRVAAFARASIALPGYAIEKTLILLRSAWSPGGDWIRTAREGDVR